MKNLLVTGSSGYVGRTFTELYSKNYNISKFSLLREDIYNLNMFDIDTILHCAALVHQEKEYPYEEYYRVNTQYTLDLAERAKKAGVHHFIFLSSIAVYDPRDTYLSLDVEPNPLTYYGKSKLEAELLINNIASTDFKVTIIRAPMIYGFKAPGNINKLKNLVDKIPLLPFGCINNKRTFVFVENLCFVLNKIIEDSTSGTFLISDDESVSTTQLMEHLVENSNKRRFVFYLPLFSSLIKFIAPSLYNKIFKDLVVDNTTSKNIIGYNTPFSFEKAVRTMYRN